MKQRTTRQFLRRGALLLICAAAAAARLWFPVAGDLAETWLLGPEGNPVTAAFSAMEDGMDDGVGAAVAAFCEEVSDASGA